MAKTSETSIVGGIIFWSFIIVKAWGTVFAAWSWWWVLLPLVPWLFYILHRTGLV